MCGLVSVHPSVHGRVECTLHAVRRNQWMQRPDFFRGEQLEGNAESFREAGEAPDLRELGGAQSQPDASDPMKTGWLSRRPLQLLVHPRCALVKAADERAVGEMRDARGGMPRRAGRQLLLLHQYTVVDSESRQVIEKAATRDAAADDQDLRLGLHADALISPTPNRRHAAASVADVPTRATDHPNAVNNSIRPIGSLTSGRSRESRRRTVRVPVTALPECCAATFAW